MESPFDFAGLGSFVDSLSSGFATAYKSYVQPGSIVVGPTGQATSANQTIKTTPEGFKTFSASSPWWTILLGVGVVGLVVLLVVKLVRK